jgi:alpha-glucosidase
LQPFFRNHSANDACRREPWLFGAAIEARAKKAVERRYRLLPYLYTLLEEAARTGEPVMRPLWLEYPNDAATYDVASEYLLGRDLLVAPKLVAGSARYRVTLPAGDWYDVQTSQRMSGGTSDVEPSPGDSVRLFARAGAIIPQAPVVQSTGEAPQGPLMFDVWPGADCSGSLYLDDGQSLGYRSGKLRRLALSCESGEGTLSVQARSSGEYPVWWKELKLVLHDVPRPPKAVTDAHGVPLAHSYDPAQKVVTVSLAGSPTAFQVSASW